MRKIVRSNMGFVIIAASIFLVLTALVAGLVLVNSNQDVRNQAATTECLARPSCLDLPNPCKIAEPAQGWCPAEHKNSDLKNDSVVCTMEAKICPDGSSVGRNANNNCEFDPCPNEANSELAKRLPTPPAGCYYQQVQCIQAPCEPVLVCPDTNSTPVCGNQKCEAGEMDQEVCPECPAGSKVCPAYACQLVKGSCPQDCRGINPPNPDDNELTACTADAKLCPDGSAVGRDPNLGCQFPACPAVNNDVDSTTRFKTADFNRDGKVNLYDYTIMVSQFLRRQAGLTADINQDGIVDLYDYTVLSTQFSL